jgi:LmbE family N-acetylglucosaminyl deacetylase
MEIGMGGTVAKLSENKNHVTSLILTKGQRAPNPAGLTPLIITKTRKEEAERAAKILGIEQTIFFQLDSLKADDFAEAGERFSKILSLEKPQQIFTLHPKLDRHRTHRLAGKLVVEVCAQKRFQGEVWAYEVWGLFPKWDRFEDISRQMRKKLKAIDAHQSQLASIPYADGIQGLNRWRAVFADPKQMHPPAQYAEVFLRLS